MNVSDTRPKLLAFTPSRSAWATRCARWSADARIPFGLARCVTLTAVFDLLSSVRAVLVDTAALTPELLAAADSQDVPVIAIGTFSSDTAAHLHDTFRVEELLQVLITLAPAREPAVAEQDPSGVSRVVIAVTGPGGTGTSTVAAMLAQGLTGDFSSVLLADLCRHASQAVLHDVHTPVDGLIEMAHAPDTADTFLPVTPIVSRGYQLLTGMRQPLQWVSLGEQHVAQAVRLLTAGEGVVVCDIDPDTETEHDTGSVGVGDRHRLTTATLGLAQLVVLVCDPSLMGVMRGVEQARMLFRVVPETVPVMVVLNARRATKHVAGAPDAAKALRALLDALAPSARPVEIVKLPGFAADACHMTVSVFPQKPVDVLRQTLARQLGCT